MFTYGFKELIIDDSCAELYARDIFTFLIRL